MSGWKWLNAPATPYTWRFTRNVVIKALILFALVNVAFALLDPLPALGRLSLYNRIVPGRPRLPYGENPDRSYNLSLQNLDALFAAHEIDGAVGAHDEYRVLLIGDSSVWGVLLAPEETLSGQLNAAALRTADGRRVRAFNLGYPVQSLLKDLLILDHALRYRPDLVIWLITPESFAPDQQLEPLLVRENPGPVRDLIARYGLRIDPSSPRFAAPDFSAQTLIGRRRPLADLLRLQLYGLAWGITGHDQTYPRFFEPRMEDFGPELSWHGFAPGELTPDGLAFDVLRAGVRRAAESDPPAPVLIINEPIFRSEGINSDVRYNYFYPRWLFDAFRDWMANQAADEGWAYLDLWDVVSPSAFTDSAVHLTPDGSRALAVRVGEALLRMAERAP